MPVASFFNKVTIQSVQDAYKRMNYPLFTSGDYNVNIFGIRSDENVSNKFNDVIGILYKVSGEWKLKVCDATTDPGLYYRQHPMNVLGTGILCDGYHKGGFKLGKHQGKYEALIQAKPLPHWRDNNKDDKLDRSGKVYSDMVGCNIHHASNTATSVNVDKWSAMCQVIASIEDWNEFLSIIKKSAEQYGSTFSYALFTEKSFFGK